MSVTQAKASNGTSFRTLELGSAKAKPARVGLGTRTSQYNGVARSTSTASPWKASLQVGKGKRRTLGVFKTEEEAARAHDAAALKEGGTHRLNFPAGAKAAEVVAPASVPGTPAAESSNSLFIEITAARDVATALSRLKPDAARRVLGFVADHYERPEETA